MISSFLFMVPVHLGTVLFALASASPEVIAEKLRFVIRVSLLIGLPVMAVLGRRALRAEPLRPRIRRAGHRAALAAHHSATSRRCRRRSSSRFPARPTGSPGSRPIGFFALCEVASVYFGGKQGNRYIGARGRPLRALFAYLGVLIVEGLITAPTVLRAAYAHTAAATAPFPAVPAAAGATGAMARVSGPLRRITGELIKLTGELPLTGPCLSCPERLTGRKRPRRALRAHLGRGGFRREHAERGDPDPADRLVPPLPPEVTGPRKVVPVASAAHDMYAAKGRRPCRPWYSRLLPASAAGWHRRAPVDRYPGLFIRRHPSHPGPSVRRHSRRNPPVT